MITFMRVLVVITFALMFFFDAVSTVMCYLVVTAIIYWLELKDLQQEPYGEIDITDLNKYVWFWPLMLECD